MTKRHDWTEAEDAILRDRFAELSAAELAALIGVGIKIIYWRAHVLGLRKSPEWVAERARQRSLQPGHGWRENQFKKGATPWNKGMHYTTGGRSGETRFRPGVRTGRALELWKPVGTLRISADGYLQRKVNDDHPMQKRWRAEHVLVWEAAHGPLLPGLAIVFRDGNKLNVALDNLECISRADLMRRNSMQRHGQEIGSITQLRGALNRQIKRRARNQLQQGETP
jgi:HNH endonuclease